jgi:hypothetical protein
MKTTCKIALMLSLVYPGISVLITGCADEGPPPRRVMMVETGFVPEYCFWDGYEYVGWYDDRYYYWGPDRAWIVCDPVRVERVNVWVTAHPDWRTRVTTVAPARTMPVPAGETRVAPAPPARRYYHEREEEHDRRGDRDHD